MNVYIGQTIGVLLVIWVIYDLYAGYTYLHRKITRRGEPLLYWVVLGIWALIATWSLGFI